VCALHIVDRENFIFQFCQYRYLFHVSNMRVVTASADGRSGGRCMLDNFLKCLWFEFAVVVGI